MVDLTTFSYSALLSFAVCEADLQAGKESYKERSICYFTYQGMY